MSPTAPKLRDYQSQAVTATNQNYNGLRRPDHPLAQKGGVVLINRMVLYDAIGPGPHKCYWCSTELNWYIGNNGVAVIGKDALLADHIDGNTANNVIDNLVPSCTACNTKRNSVGKILPTDTTILQDHMRRAVELICTVCNEPYLVQPNRQSVSIFCSKRCEAVARTKRVKRKCKFCGKVFEVRPSVTKRFCSGSCSALNRYYEPII